MSAEFLKTKYILHLQYINLHTSSSVNDTVVQVSLMSGGRALPDKKLS
jgi:hypothetical protein